MRKGNRTTFGPNRFSIFFCCHSYTDSSCPLGLEMEGGVRQWHSHPVSFDGGGTTSLLPGGGATTTGRGATSAAATVITAGVFPVWGRPSCWRGETPAERRDSFTAMWESLQGGRDCLLVQVRDTSASVRMEPLTFLLI